MVILQCIWLLDTFDGGCIWNWRFARSTCFACDSFDGALATSGPEPEHRVNLSKLVRWLFDDYLTQIDSDDYMMVFDDNLSYLSYLIL